MGKFVLYMVPCPVTEAWCKDRKFVRTSFYLQMMVSHSCVKYNHQ